MESITTVLVLLLAVVLSGTLSRMVPALPRPLVQIAFGAGVALVARLRVELDPEIFFVLLLPPLLFLDGWRIPNEDLLKDRATILELSLGLVVFTVLGMGLFIHWMVPSIPLPVAFALAAVLSPTDPIAVSSIARRVPIPTRMMRILEGESLLNDASGLVCLRFAVAATLTGSFSLFEAGLTFLWLATAGIATGIGVSLAISRAQRWVSRSFGEEVGSQILVSLLMPFAAYLSAEAVHSSGILAAVAAGVTMSFTESTGRALAATRMQRSTFWDMIQFAANGVIFVLLGEQLPAIVAGATKTVATTGHLSPWWLVAYVLSITSALSALRFAWVWVSLRLTLFRTGQKTTTPNWRIVAAMCLAGVRGAVTLAGILTLPLATNDSTPFPARDLTIFLAMGTIILSMLLAGFGLPLLLRGLRMPAPSSHFEEESAARVAAAQAAIASIEQVQHERGVGRHDTDAYVTAASRIMNSYRHRIETQSQAGEGAKMIQRNEQIEVELRLAGIKAERAEIFRLLRHRQLGSQVARSLVQELDLLEARISRQR